MTTPRSYLGFVAAILLAGCAAVGPDYRAPSPPGLKAGGDFAAASEAAGRAAARPEPDLATWWEGYGDPDLNRIVGRIASGNLDIKVARARLDRAAAAARLARAELLPNAAAQGSAAIQRQSLEGPLGQLTQLAPGLERTDDLYTLGIAASWEIDLFGGARRGREAATAEAQAVHADLSAVKVSVIAEAADTYFLLRQFQHRRAVLREQEAVAARLVDLASARAGAGVGSEQDVRRARAQLGQVQAAIPVVDATVVAQLNRLDVLMGERPGSNAASLLELRPIPAPPTLSTAGGVGAMLRRRPDLLAAERRLAAANARIGLAIAEYYPKVSLSGLLGFEASDPGRLLTGAASTSSGLLGVRWRLFDFGRVDAAVADARGGEREALATYRSSVLKAVEEVENSLAVLVRREAQARLLSGAEADLAASRTSARASYAAGATRLDEALDVERQLTIVRQDRVDAEAEAARAGVAAFRALGGGWS